MRIRKTSILTGKWRIRHSWFFNKLIVQVQYVHGSWFNYTGKVKDDLRWRDARISDLDVQEGGK